MSENITECAGVEWNRVGAKFLQSGHVLRHRLHECVGFKVFLN